MLPEDIEAWLGARMTPTYRAHLAAVRNEHIRILDELGIPIDSELGYFYLEFGPLCARGWYELAQLESVSDWTAYAHEELGVPKHFLGLSSVEGQGIILYDTRSRAVFDVEFGQFDALQNGELQPTAATFSGFLRWCMDRDSAA